MSGAEELSPTDRHVHYFSDWHRLKKAVAWILRFKKFLRSRGVKTDGRAGGSVTRSRTRRVDGPSLSSEELNVIFPARFSGFYSAGIYK